ncbi:hypothetical protein T439DRAFT_380893 [Meredithblackwellia eburnea MCA 4105]
MPTSSSTASYQPLFQPDVLGSPTTGGGKRAWTNAVRRPAIFVPLATAAVLAVLIVHQAGKVESFSLQGVVQEGVDRLTGGQGSKAGSWGGGNGIGSGSGSGSGSAGGSGWSWNGGASGGSQSEGGNGAGTGNHHSPDGICNPFELKGRLQVDTAVPTNNRWVPYDSTCPSSTFMGSIWRSADDHTPLIPAHKPDNIQHPSVDGTKPNPQLRQFLPWFMNRTVLIHGDSIDRFHVKDFCALVNGKLFNVGPDHPASPKPYHSPHEKEVGPDGEETAESKKRFETRLAKEKAWEGRPKDGVELTNPWVCDIEEYGTTIISVFTWGLQGAEEFFEMERWYYPPATWTDRLDYITLPLLEGLAKFLDRPAITKPDLVEINSGYWDLRKYTEEDMVAAGWTSRPYPEDTNIPYTNLSPERESTWETEARLAIARAAGAFPGTDGRTKSGPTILWRSLHAPPQRHNYAPFPRVSTLDNLQMKVIADMQQESRIGKNDLGLDERLRIDYSGHLLRGQEHHFRDLLHPQAVPGSYLWGDVILYELKRAVSRTGRSWAA